jgi:phytoene dehydrogenase-like protein
MALPLFMVYLGLDIDLSEQGIPNTNFHVWNSYDIEGIHAQLEEGKIPDKDGVFMTVATLKDPQSSHLAPKGYSNVQVMTLVPRDYKVWHVDKGPAEGGRYHRDPDYRREKSAFTERLLSVAEQVIPGIRDHIDWKEAATPVTQERFTRSTGGTSYGVEFATDQMGPFRMGPETEIQGLFLCGASTPSGHGISQVLRSGVIAAGAVLETDLLRLVRSGEVLGDREALPPLRDDWDAWRESQ